MNKFILFIAIIIVMLFSSSCIEKPSPTETPFKYKTATPVPTQPPQIVEIKTINEKITIEKITLDAKRQVNLRKYYWEVNQNKTLVAYKQFGIYTQNFPEAEKISDELWEKDTFILTTIINPELQGTPRWSYRVNETFSKTDDPILDYIKKTNWFTYYYINEPREAGKYRSNRTTAQIAFYIREGTCEQKSFVMAVLLRNKGIPVRFIAMQTSSPNWSGEPKHAFLYAYTSEGWVLADPQFSRDINVTWNVFDPRKPLKDRLEITNKASLFYNMERW